MPPRQNAYSIFTIGLGVTAEIDNLTITGGYASFNGGGIANNGVLTLNGDMIDNNVAAGSGGGIYNSSSATLNMTNVNVKLNDAVSSGGGIENFGEVTGGQCTIASNLATGGLGGGIYNGLDASMTLSNTQIVNNKSGGTFGGGVYNAGSFELDAGAISGNSITTNVGMGGGLYNSSKGTVFLDVNVTIENNSANMGAGLFLSNGSLTNLYSVTTANNVLVGNNAAGKGIYKQIGAQLSGDSPTDPDDPGGQPVQGP